MSHPHWTPSWPPPPGVNPATYCGHGLEPIYGLTGSVALPMRPPPPPTFALTAPRPWSTTPTPKLKPQHQTGAKGLRVQTVGQRKVTHPSLTPSGLHQIKERMRILHDSLEQLVDVMKEYSQETQPESGVSDGNQQSEVFVMARQEADRCKAELSILQAKLTPENLLTVARKVKKAQKHKIWEQRKIKEMQEYRNNTESRREKLHAEIDRKWARKLAREKGNEMRRSQQEQTRLKKLKESQAALKEKKLLTLVQKLDQLRMLRRERLKREGHFFPEEDQEFYERIQQQEQDLARRKKEQEERQEKKKQARNERVEARQQKMAQQKMAQQELEQSEETTGSNDSTKGRKGRVKKQKLKEPTSLEDTHPTVLPPLPAFPLPHVNVQTLQSLDVPSEFIELSEQEACDQRGYEEIQMIRELWSHYVVGEDSHGGSCIPLDLGDPPPPSSHFWAALLFNKPIHT